MISFRNGATIYRTLAQAAGVSELDIHLLMNHSLPAVNAGYITRDRLLSVDPSETARPTLSGHFTMNPRGRDLNRLTINTARKRRSASIKCDDALILPHRANPAGYDFRERHLMLQSWPMDEAGLFEP